MRSERSITTVILLFGFFFFQFAEFVLCLVAVAAVDVEGADGSQILVCHHPADVLALRLALTRASDTYFICFHGPYSL